MNNFKKNIYIKSFFRIIYIFILTVLFFYKNSYASETAEFLHILQGAGASGMAEAYVSNSECLFNFEYNPAGISFSDSNQIAFSHYEYYANIKNEYFAVLLKPKKNFVLASSLKISNIDDVERDSLGNQTGNFNNTSYQMKTGAGFLFSKNFGAGLAISYISNKIYTQKSSVIAADAGFLISGIDISENSKINLGVSFQNIGDKMSFGGQSYSLPQKTRLGFSIINNQTFPKIIKKTTFSTDFVFNSELENTLNIGIEVLSYKDFALRAGMIDYLNVSQKSTITFGAGFQHNFGDIDYAYRQHETLGGTHTLSFVIKFGNKNKI